MKLMCLKKHEMIMTDYMKMKIWRITDQLQRSWMHFIRLLNSRKKAITVVNNGSKRGEVYLVGEINFLY